MGPIEIASGYGPGKVTQQKEDLKDILTHMVMDIYNKQDDEGKRATVISLLVRYMNTMTLKQLRGWHQAFGISQMMKEREG